MSSAAPAEPDAPAWTVRRAGPGEAPAVVDAVSQLLVELGSTPPPRDAMEAAADAVLADDEAGFVLLAEAAGDVVGVLAASWSLALHVPGRYAVVQDLWVDPAWRSQAIGAALLDALFAVCAERGVVRAEVGIPRDDFPQLAATRAFYERNGFAYLGARLRRIAA